MLACQDVSLFKNRKIDKVYTTWLHLPVVRQGFFGWATNVLSGKFPTEVPQRTNEKGKR